MSSSSEQCKTKSNILPNSLKLFRGHYSGHVGGRKRQKWGQGRTINGYHKEIYAQKTSYD